MKKTDKNKMILKTSNVQTNEFVSNEAEIAKLFNEIKIELKTNKTLNEFFNKYNTISVEAFIDNYAMKKARYVTYGELLNKSYEKAAIRRQEEAEERLWEIQRKKLFDLECQWRADTIRIPEIEITADFEFWEKNIENCHFLSPITDDEFELYVDYISSEEFYDFKMEFLWMNYKDIKESYNEYSNLPPWYEYYNLRKGTGSYLILPDIRGDKEEYYLNIWRNHKAAQLDNTKVKKVKRDYRPSLKSYDLNMIEEFIKRFEDCRILEYFKIYEGELHKSNDEVEMAYRILKEADEVIQIQSNYNWKSAVIQTARKYEQKKTIEALKTAFSNYKYRRKCGIAQEILTREEDIAWLKEWSDDMKKKIIFARTLNNEPADLNF